MNHSWQRMTFGQKRLWEAVRISPEKWSCVVTPSLEGEGWVVAITGKQVIWYNDYVNEMDDGFCISAYKHYGRILPNGEIGAGLEDVLRSLLTRIVDPSFG
jgi:hypothetical protein